MIYNPVKVDVDDLRAAIAAEPASAGWAETLWFETTEEDPGRGQAKEALEAGVDMVIAAGGDGTVRAVAEMLRRHVDVARAAPVGHGQPARPQPRPHARRLGALARDRVRRRRPARSTRMGRHQTRGRGRERAAYLVMAGLGLDAKMLANTDDELKAKAGWLAYVQAIGTALRDKNQLHIRYQLDGGAQHRAAHTIMVGNCGSLPANILLLPDASVDDGEFDIVVLRPEGPFGWVQIVVKVFWENGVLRRTRGGRKLIGPGGDACATCRAAEGTRAQPSRGGRARRRQLRPRRRSERGSTREPHRARAGGRGRADRTVTETAASVDPRPG